MLPFNTFGVTIHFNNPFCNFVQSLISGSLIYTHSTHIFLSFKICFVITPRFFLPLHLPSSTPLSAPTPKHPAPFSSANSFPGSSTPGCCPSQPGHSMFSLPTYHPHPFPLPLVCSALSSLRITVFDAVDRQCGNRVILLCYCRLLSPSVSGRGPPRSCLLFLIMSVTF